MKTLIKKVIMLVIALSMAAGSAVSAQSFDFFNPSPFGFPSQNSFDQQSFQPLGILPLSAFPSREAYYQYILNTFFTPTQNTFNQFTPVNQSFIPTNQSSFIGGTPGFTFREVPVNNSFSNNNFSSSNNNFSNNNGSRPDVETRDARDIEDDSAELRGFVDMNDAENGTVFFVYGQDESRIRDVERDFDDFRDVEDDEDSDDFEVERVETNFDGRDNFEETVSGLEEDEEYFFVLCVEYEDNNRDRLECGSVEDFDTDDDNGNNNNNNDDEPEVETVSAIDIDDDSARLRGDVDMNDFNNGRVFFVWGEDEDEIEDAEDEDRFNDIDEDGDDIQTQSVQTNFNGNGTFSLNVFNLDDDTDHYFRICVEYEDEDNDDTLECGDVEDFETDN